MTPSRGKKSASKRGAVLQAPLARGRQRTVDDLAVTDDLRPDGYAEWLTDVKARVHSAQQRAAHTVNTGGFARIVHKRDTKGNIVRGAEFATAGVLDHFGRDLTGFPFPDPDDESAWLDLTIQHRTATAFQGAMVERGVVPNLDRMHLALSLTESLGAGEKFARQREAILRKPFTGSCR